MLDANDVIALEDHTVLNVLHAHVRATRITDFCLRADFNLFADLEHYFSMYWTVFTNRHDETIGHPSGQLCEVYLTKPSGIAFHAPPMCRQRLNKLWSSLDMYDEYISSVQVDRNFHLHRQRPYHNWSTVDLDKCTEPCQGSRSPTPSIHEYL